MMVVRTCKTPIGTIRFAVENKSLVALMFEDDPFMQKISGESETVMPASKEQNQDPEAQSMCIWIEDYFKGKISAVPLVIKPKGTEFQVLIWNLLCKIPFGETRTYKQIAISAGIPNGFRAAANAIAANPILLAVPCHRVIESSGALGGFRGGIMRKEFLLDLEKRPLH